MSSSVRIKNNHDGRKVCQKCGDDWGQPTAGCYVREHNLLEAVQPTVQDSLEDIEESETDSLLARKHVKPAVTKRKRKIVEMLERYPPVITYHIF